MQILNRKAYDDLDIKLQIGNLMLNVLYIRFLPGNPDRYNRYHCHSSYELHFIPFGYGTLFSEGKSYDITPGTFFLTGPQIYHEQITYAHDPMGECCINFELTYTKGTRKQWDNLPRGEVEQIVRMLLKTKFWFGKDEYDSTGLFEKIEVELDRKLVGYYHIIRNYVSEIIINAVRCYSNHQQAGYDLPRRNLNEMREQRLSRLFNNSEEPLTLELIADDLGLSKRQASRIVRRYYHTNYKQKQIDDKLKLAKKLLLTTNLTIQEISLKTGFSSASYFCSRFKQHENVTPTSYRMRRGIQP